MKRYIAVLVAILILGFSSLAGAALYADFWAVDAANDKVTTLDFTLFTTPASLWYSTDEINWFMLFNSESPFSALSSTLTFKGKSTTHLYLQLDNPLSTSAKASTFASALPATPVVSFNGPDAENLYNSLFIQWSGTGNPLPFMLITPMGNDKLASESPVPIPTAALLFSTGLIGFIGAKRKKLI